MLGENSKHEIRNSKQIQNSNDRMTKTTSLCRMFRTFGFSSFDLVSDFDIRISDFY